MKRKDRNQLFECWCCQESFKALNGVSVDNSDRFHVCHECWEKIPHAQRLYLGYFFRALEDGGAGIKEMIANASHDVFFRGLLGGSDN